MILWYPKATKKVFENAGSFISGSLYRGVLHTTEGTSPAGAFAAYKTNRSAPHFTVDADKVYQHIPLDKAARSLLNPAGGVETNLLGAIQIENVGFAKDGLKYSDTLRDLLRWIEEQTGIGAYYPALNVRFSPQQWVVYNGWCGHIHVPENDHTDPGPVDQRLFEIVPATAPTQEDDEMKQPTDRIAVARVPGSVIKRWELTRDGGVRALGGAAFYGSYPGLPEGQRLGTRDFIDIQAAGQFERDGYIIYGDDDTQYHFHA